MRSEMADSLVSIVIPVYKVEKYLDRCMQSVVNQTYENLEIIMVDDGSPDNCPALCEEWAARDKRIKVVHKTNAGLGMARNTGIEHASGDYICFFDSDDYVALDTVENSLRLAHRDHSDLVLFGLNNVDVHGEILRSGCPSTEKTYFEGSQIVDFVLPNMIAGSAKAGQHYNLNMSSCCCLFSLKLIRDSHWRFVSEREFISEDFYSLLKLYAHVKSVSILRQACYYYCYNDASLTHVFRPERYERICHCYRAMLQMAADLHYPKVVEEALSTQYFGNVIGTMKLIAAASDLDDAEKVKKLREIIKEDTFGCALRKTNFAAESAARKILILAARMKCAELVYVLVKAKS